MPHIPPPLVVLAPRLIDYPLSIIDYRYRIVRYRLRIKDYRDRVAAECLNLLRYEHPASLVQAHNVYD